MYTCACTHVDTHVHTRPGTCGHQSSRSPTHRTLGGTFNAKFDETFGAKFGGTFDAKLGGTFGAKIGWNI